MTEAELVGERIPRITKRTLSARPAARWPVRLNLYDVASLALLAVLVVIVFATYRHYAISNDEGVQHRYGELIIAYYASGFADQSVFNFQNLYLYGGLFDILAVGLSHVLPLDPYDLRHILCGLIGVGGIAATAAMARLIAGSRAGLIAAISLALCGVWYGAMFNHTKDIPFAAAMMGAELFLIRIAYRLPSPRRSDVVAFGLLAGSALGIRIIGLLLVLFMGIAIALYAPRPWRFQGRARLRFARDSFIALLPALAIAYGIMIVAWPWAALAPLNPIRGLLAFSEFNYSIRTLLAGQIYEMADVPRLYVPIYVMIRVPLVTLFGAALALLSVRLLPADHVSSPGRARDVALLSTMLFVPLVCQAAFHGPAFTGLRHFLFVIPLLAVLAGIGFDKAFIALKAYGRIVAAGGIAIVSACFAWDAVILVRLHPYEYLFYNALVGGLDGASRRYDLDYWFDSMPEAIGKLEAYLHASDAQDKTWRREVYSVAVCGERLAFEKAVTLPQLRWDFMPQWNQSQFFLAPTNLNCDNDLDGKIVATVERLGVPIAYVKDRRALTRPVTAQASPMP